MSSGGESETKQLKRNLEEQLERLVQQLADLEECKDELDASEYAESRADTQEQLLELDATLKKHLSGDVTLVDQLSAMRAATQAAISSAFCTPEVIRMFARQEPGQLRERLGMIERDLKLGKVTPCSAEALKVEILTALRHLGEQLSAEELRTLASSAAPDSNPAFEQVSQRTDVGERSAMNLASRELAATQCLRNTPS